MRAGGKGWKWLSPLLLWASTGVGAAGMDASAHPPPDTLAQRLQACTACHGPQGRATQGGYFPRIAGKLEGYLYQQLLNFRDGRRTNEGMTGLLDTLSDAYLREIAAHFASLDLPYPPPQAPELGTAALERARQLVRQGDPALGVPACQSCHGQVLTGRPAAFPGLLGLSRDYLAAQLGAWKTGQRRALEPDCMGDIARRLKDSDIGALAHWLAAQPADGVATSVSPRRAREAIRSAVAPAPPPLRCGSGPK
jgi:cytochrome c553